MEPVITTTHKAAARPAADTRTAASAITLATIAARTTNGSAASTSSRWPARIRPTWPSRCELITTLLRTRTIRRSHATLSRRSTSTPTSGRASKFASAARSRSANRATRARLAWADTAMAVAATVAATPAATAARAARRTPGKSPGGVWMTIATNSWNRPTSRRPSASTA
jgi:hypothetical protein